jgi:hypothetical protein
MKFVGRSEVEERRRRNEVFSNGLLPLDGSKTAAKLCLAMTQACVEILRFGNNRLVAPRSLTDFRSGASDHWAAHGLSQDI